MLDYSTIALVLLTLLSLSLLIGLLHFQDSLEVSKTRILSLERAASEDQKDLKTARQDLDDAQALIARLTASKAKEAPKTTPRGLVLSTLDKSRIFATLEHYGSDFFGGVQKARSK